jgi:hypothetical protein
MAFLYSSANLPIPLGPTAATLRNGCTDTTTTAPIDLPFYTGQADFPKYLNDLVAAMSTLGTFAGQSYSIIGGLKLYTAYDNGHTYAVGDYASYSGTTYVCILGTTGNLPTNATYWTATSFAAVTGLNIGVISGVGTCRGQLEFAGGTITLPDNTSQVYVWLKASAWNGSTLTSGTLDKTTTTTPPTNDAIYLGCCTTSAGVISAIDYSGVLYNMGGVAVRYVADRSAPVDSPTANTGFHTVTQAGTYHWNGSAYNSLTPTAAGGLNCKQIMVADLTLLPQDAFMNFQLDPNGSNRTVLIPNPANIGPSWRCSLTHIGSANSIVVKDYTGTTTLGTLTTTNRSLAFGSYMNSSGNVAFPVGPWAPGPIPTPAAGALV